MNACPYCLYIRSIYRLYMRLWQETYIMLTQPNRDGRPILETRHAVFPVSNMVPQYLSQDIQAEIEGVEVHVKCINSPIRISVIVHNDCA